MFYCVLFCVRSIIITKHTFTLFAAYREIILILLQQKKSILILKEFFIHEKNNKYWIHWKILKRRPKDAQIFRSLVWHDTSNHHLNSFKPGETWTSLIRWSSLITEWLTYTYYPARYTNIVKSFTKGWGHSILLCWLMD